MIRFDSRKRVTDARTPGEPFSPNRPNQRLNHRQSSPAVLTTLVSTATSTGSFEGAAELLTIAEQWKVSPRHLQTLSQEVGGELVDEQRWQTADYRSRPLMTPPKAGRPPLPQNTVMTDGGRIQTRQPDHGPEVHDLARRESKTAILLRMPCTPSAHDLQPNLPACFDHSLLGT